MAQFLLDENVPRQVRGWLNKQGFTTVSVFEIGLKGAKNKEIAEYAQRGNLAILTLDTDFAQIYHMLLRRKLTVIVIKAKPATHLLT